MRMNKFEGILLLYLATAIVAKLCGQLFGMAGLDRLGSILLGLVLICAIVLVLIGVPLQLRARSRDRKRLR
jgi:hypothetical protein